MTSANEKLLMKKTVKRRTEITIETHEIRIVRGGSVFESPGQVLSTEVGDPAPRVEAEQVLTAVDERTRLANPELTPANDELDRKL